LRASCEKSDCVVMLVVHYYVILAIFFIFEAISVVLSLVACFEECKSDILALEGWGETVAKSGD